MIYDPDRHHRRSIRLRDYDYSRSGASFVTLCTYHNACLFGDVIEGMANLSALGSIVADCWTAIPAHFPDTDLDAFVVMPNHLHGIVVIDRPFPTRNPAVGTRATHASPLQPGLLPRGPKPRSLAAIVGSFKAAVSRRANNPAGSTGGSLWQRNYYEHIVRNDRELDRVRTYIAANPSRWTEDAEHPNRQRR